MTDRHADLTTRDRRLIIAGMLGAAKLTTGQAQWLDDQLRRAGSV